MQSFTSSYSLPPEGTNFVGAPPLRGTLQILWTCLSVLILCTWSVVHLNVPPQIKVRSKKQKLRRASKRFFSKAKWMLFNILAPQWIFTKALSDFLLVRGLRAKFIAQAEKDGIAWSNAHTHFAEMGGFGISFDGLTIPQADTSSGTAKMPAGVATDSEKQESVFSIETKSNCPTNFESFFWKEHIERFLAGYKIENGLNQLSTILSQTNADEQGWQIDSHNSNLVREVLSKSAVHVLGPIKDYHADNYMNLMILTANLWIPNASQLLLIRELGLIDSLPNIDQDDLDDRTSDSSIIKVIAIMQICWFDLQFIIRICTGMTNTHLEVLVFAFTIFSIASYALMWSRPKGPEYTIILKATTHPRSSADMAKVATKGPFYMFSLRRSTIWIANHLQPKGSNVFGVDLPYLSIFVSNIGTVIFGALHCIAWNFSFPSKTERILWQTSSIISTVYPILASTMLLYGERSVWDILAIFTAKRLSLGFYVIVVSYALFASARIFILVEVFRSLAYQPPGAFESTWTANLPHIG